MPLKACRQGYSGLYFFPGCTRLFFWADWKSPIKICQISDNSLIQDLLVYFIAGKHCHATIRDCCYAVRKLQVRLQQALFFWPVPGFFGKLICETLSNFRCHQTVINKVQFVIIRISSVALATKILFCLVSDKHI